jgi:hypothetical protein
MYTAWPAGLGCGPALSAVIPSEARIFLPAFARIQAAAERTVVELQAALSKPRLDANRMPRQSGKPLPAEVDLVKAVRLRYSR